MMGILKEEQRQTYSVCPICLKRISAIREERDGQVVLTKTCPQHGSFSSVIWRNKIDFAGWRGNRPSVKADENLNCPAGCGLCPEHLRATCCTLLEITDHCNMNCAFCFANPSKRTDPSLETIRGWIDDLTVPGKTLLQLSGGEPTVREDLPEIVACAKAAGCKYVQLNSNGLRLAEDEEFVKKLANAGLSFVFMQFDGVEDSVYQKLRGRPLLEIKKKAISNCGKYGIGVTLVPVIVPGVNVDQIGAVIRFAVEQSPFVRGVHFQPVSYFGRVPKLPEDTDRFTLDELMEQIAAQSGGLLAMEDFAPSCCDHPMCGFHGDFIVMPDRTLMALTKGNGEREKSHTCCIDPAEKNREFVGRRWERRGHAAGREMTPETGGCCCEEQEAFDMTSMEGFLKRAQSHGFTITSMAFQDAGNLDIERLRQCSLHVYKDGKHIPFCAYYLSPLREEAPTKTC